VVRRKRRDRWLLAISSLVGAGTTGAARAQISADGDTAPASAPSVDARALEKSVGVELARREVQLAMLGVRLRFERSEAGHWSATLEKSGWPECNRRVELGQIERVEAEQLRPVTDAVAAALREQAGCPKPATVRPSSPAHGRNQKRVGLLRDAVNDTTRRSTTLAVWGGVEAALGLAWLGLMAVDPLEGTKLGFGSEADAALTSYGLFVTGSGAAVLLVPEDYRPAAAAMSLPALAAPWLGLALSTESRTVRASALLFAEGAVLSAGLGVFRAVLRPPPYAALRRSAIRLSGDPTDADVRYVEGLLRSTEPALPNWVVFGPFVMGTIAGTLNALTADKGDRDGRTAALVGATMLPWTWLYLLPVSPWRRYQSALSGAGLRALSLGPGPRSAGVSVSGAF
jgi:hypothetical protein